MSWNGNVYDKDDEFHGTERNSLKITVECKMTTSERVYGAPCWNRKRPEDDMEISL